jgi:hypothetical protein
MQNERSADIQEVTDEYLIVVRNIVINDLWSQKWWINKVSLVLIPYIKETGELPTSQNAISDVEVHVTVYSLTSLWNEGLRPTPQNAVSVQYQSLVFPIVDIHPEPCRILPLLVVGSMLH